MLSNSQGQCPTWTTGHSVLWQGAPLHVFKVRTCERSLSDAVGPSEGVLHWRAQHCPKLSTGASLFIKAVSVITVETLCCAPAAATERARKPRGSPVIPPESTFPSAAL